MTKQFSYMTERKQITLRIPGEVYEALQVEAKERGYSVNELIMFKISPIDTRFVFY